MDKNQPSGATCSRASNPFRSKGFPTIEPDRFDVVVIDEFHHAEAASYRRLLDHVQPIELVGLTATPERADGVDVREFFGGRVAAELRLWEALEQNLLCPFHYFGIHDGTDLETVQWKRGGYDLAALSNVYTGNDARTRIVLKELDDKVADVAAMRALGFCVSVEHARYMAQRFVEAGIPALAVSADTSAADRRDALTALRNRDINILFAVDLFNEGLDIPEVDTVLFLRPTESATVFLQQLGRGLRLTRGKTVLTALDFVGHQRREFRFDQRFRAMSGVGGKALQRQVEEGFPFLPSGSQIVLDAVARDLVLENIRQQVAPRWAALVSRGARASGQPPGVLSRCVRTRPGRCAEEQSVVDDAVSRLPASSARTPGRARPISSSGFGRLPTSTTVVGGRHISRSSTARVIWAVRPRSVWRRCCSSRCSPMVADSTAPQQDSTRFRMKRSSMRCAKSSTSHSTRRVAAPTSWATSSPRLPTFRSRFTRATPVRRSLRRWTLRPCAERRAPCAKASPGAKPSSRRVPDHAEEVGPRLLADDDVSRLRAHP